MEIAVGVLAASPAGEREDTAFGIAAIFAAVPNFFVEQSEENDFLRREIDRIQIFLSEQSP